MFNPGTVLADNGYFDSADLIVTAEYAYAEFEYELLCVCLHSHLTDIPDSISTSIPSSPDAPIEKQVVILHTGPSTTDTSLAQNLSNLGVGGIFLTDYNINDAYSFVPSDFDGLVAALESA